MSQPLSPSEYPALLKRAYVSLDKLQARIDELERGRTEPVAVVGMACRFPGGATTPEAFWQLLRGGGDGIREVPRDRWNLEELYDPDPETPGKMYSRHGGFLEDVAGFDSEFFGISPREAAGMDPQQRLLLEVSWEALERAGESSAKLAGSCTGVFVGLCISDYAHFGIGGPVDRIDAYSGTGVAHSVAAGRIAYALGLRGPALAVDTACSSSMVALHLACQSLRNRECQMALAGGANLLLAPGLTVCFCKLRALAPDGHCKTFDAAADGYVRGEGCGVLVLKRLSDAIAERNTILALIRGSAINHDGASGGLTVPSGLAQQAVIRAALENARLAAGDLSYIEAHGTGTALGDPIEVRALGAVVASGKTPPEGPVWLGSVKTNIGHLEGAAGIASVIKTVLALRHAAIPPSLHFRNGNPRIEWERLPFAIPTKVTPWEAKNGKRLAGVSSFGFSGTNAHLILEEAPAGAPAMATAEPDAHLLCLSARSEKALDEILARYMDYLADGDDSWADICFTANSGRMHFAHRIAVVAESSHQARAVLLSAPPRVALEPGKPPRLAIYFSASPASPGIGAKLWETQPVFREALRGCEQATRPWLEASLLQWMFEAPATEAWSERVARVAQFALQYGLWRMWQSFGIAPGAVSFDGAGEYAAACAAGVCTLEDGLRMAAGDGYGELNGRRAAPLIDLLPGGLRRLQSEGYPVVVELSPETAAWPQVLGNLAALYRAGIEIDGAAVDAGFARTRVVLPVYPFQHEAHWASSAPAADHEPSKTGLLLGTQIAGTFQERLFESRLQPADLPLLRDHRVYGSLVFPAAGYLGLALEAAAASFGPAAYVLEDVTITKPLVLPESGAVCVQTRVSPQDADAAQFFVEKDEYCHASGRIRRPGAIVSGAVSIGSVGASCSEPISPSAFYESLAHRKIHLGPSYRRIARLAAGQDQAVCDIETSPAAEPAAYIDPVVLDSCLQLLGAARADQSNDAAYVPVSIDRLTYFGVRAAPARAHAALSSKSAGGFSGEFQLFDKDGRVLVKGEGVRFVKADGSTMQAPRPDMSDCFYEVVWKASHLVDRRGPAFFPRPGGIASELRSRLETLGREQGLDRYAALSLGLEKVSAVFVHAALRRLGWAPGSPAAESHDALADRLGIIRSQRRLFSRMLEIASEDVSPVSGSPEEAWQTLLSRYPDCETELTLVERCGQGLDGVLTGALDPIELLFPKGSTGAIEKIYRASPFARLWNSFAAEALACFLRAIPEGRTLRILEVGAGTGATTSYILPLLDPSRTEYVFTDISAAFTMAAEREKFQENKFVRYAVLDIERTPAEQGFDQHAFDIVIAANVLHATRDLAQTLRNVRELLAPEGLLLLVEGVRKERWTDIVFGLTEGWWRFSDTGLRAAHPLLSESQWVHLLENSGFSEAAAVSGSGSTSQALILARAHAAPLGSWLILGEPDGFTNRLARMLEDHGATCRIVRDLVEHRDTPLAGVIHAASLSKHSQSAGCYSVLDLVKSLAHRSQHPRLWLLTRGAQSPDGGPVPGLEHATIWGLAKVIAIEHPELHCVTVDLDPLADPADSAESLFREILSGTEECEIAFRHGHRFVPRLVRALSPGQQRLAVPEGPFELAITERGILDNLFLRRCAAPIRAAGEVEIEIRATGLNFLDVMDASGVLPFERESFGAECAGIILGVGEGVTRWKPGDAVVALASRSFGRSVTTRADLVAEKPASMSFEEAAAIPVAFLTAFFALHSLARMSAGEKVLIHAAAGGVGMAAVQLARNAGLEVFATAGRPEKRAFLESLGIRNVLDSRSISFAADLQRLTGGEGVDIVLNSLAGDFIPASIGVLKPKGRFVEIGKTGIWDASRFAALKPEASYFVYDLARHAMEEPAQVAQTLAEIMRRFDDGLLRPLPLKRFPIDEVTDAFRLMARSQHIGKIVVTPRVAVELRANASYLITGGLGGLGLLVAQWLASRGATHLILVGRRAPDQQAAAAVNELERSGVRVRVVQADVSSYEELNRSLAAARAAMPPLRGVIHSAGTLNDGVLLQQDEFRFASVLGPKVDGAWNLHRLTSEVPLDFFVLFSSAASVWGSPGQGNHAAANAFLDALARHRRAQGLPAISINWGPWSDLGAAAERHVGRKGSDLAVTNISPREGTHALERVLWDAPAQAVVARVDWTEFARIFGAAGARPIYTEVTREARGAKPISESTACTELRDRVRRAFPSERNQILFEFVHAAAVKVLGGGASRRLNPRQPLNELGLDSLMALELRNTLAAGAGRSLPATLLFDYPNLETVTAFLLREIAPDLPPSPPEVISAEEGRADFSEIANLSEEQAEEVLLRELGQAGY